MTDESAKRLSPELVVAYAEQMRVGPEDYLRLLGTFLSRNAERLAELRTAISDRDLETAQRVAHSVKGTALTLRLADMAVIAERLEDALRSGTITGLDDSLASLEHELELIRKDAEALR